MTEKEIKKTIKDMRNFQKSLTDNSDGEAKDFLNKTGIYTKKGNLKKPYK
jgi:hypothetical protein